MKYSAHIISASRRTDIPHYYAEWFSNRRREGFAEYRTVYGGGKHGYFRVSLKSEDVVGYLFWTKYAGSFHDQLNKLREEKIPYVFQYTISGYGNDVQENIPPVDKVIGDFCRVAEELNSPEAIQWRYDPILISNTYNKCWHLKNFEKIARQLSGMTNVVNVSFTEPYLKIISKAPEGEVVRWRKPDHDRHKTAVRRHSDMQFVGEEEILLLKELDAIGKAYGIDLRICCNLEYISFFPRAQCCSEDMFKSYGDELFTRVSDLPAGPSRESCSCVKTVDIGMDTTCLGGCFYCYVTTNRERALINYEMHNPQLPHLR